MESLRRIFIFTLVIGTQNLMAQENIQVVGLFYLNRTFAHLHQSPQPSSLSLTTIACGHPLKVLKTQKENGKEWFYTEVGAHKGYISEDFISSIKPECLQSQYPAFFNSLNLDLAQMYYWGRLNDQFIEVEVKAP